MSGKELYVPILKWKQGEQIALKKTKSTHANKIVPLIEIVDDEQVDVILNQYNLSWNRIAYVDTIVCDDDERTFLLNLIKASAKNDTPLYPVIYYFDFEEVVNELIESTNRVALRILMPGNLDDPEPEEIIDDCRKWAKDKDIDIDIILDLGSLKGEKAAKMQYKSARDLIKGCLLDNKFWNNIIIASTSFPENLGSLESLMEIKVARYDYMVWKKLYLYEDFNNIQNNLIFSDYGVSKYTDSEIDFSKLKNGILPKARYTLKDVYWIIKGGRNKITKKMIKGYKEIAEQISSSPFYYGKDFSFGDEDIYDRSNGLNNKKGGGNREWVIIGANHHIAVVVEQLSSLLEI